MKKFLSLCLIVCIVFSMSACGTEMSPAENALIAVKALEMEDFFDCMTSNADTASVRIQSLYASLEESEKISLRSLYALLQYTIGEETEETGDAKTISVTVKHPDMDRIKTLAEKKLLVSAETAQKVISDMMESGEISGYYMAEETFELLLKKEDGKWKLSYADKANETFFEMLYLTEMISFFAQH